MSLLVTWQYKCSPIIRLYGLFGLSSSLSLSSWTRMFGFCCRQICWTFLEVKCKEGHDSQGEISNYCSLKYNQLNFIHSVFIKKHTRNAILPQKTAWQKKNDFEQLLFSFYRLLEILYWSYSAHQYLQNAKINNKLFC